MCVIVLLWGQMKECIMNMFCFKLLSTKNYCWYSHNTQNPAPMCLSLSKGGKLRCILFIVSEPRRLTGERICSCPSWNQVITSLVDTEGQVGPDSLKASRTASETVQSCFCVVLWCDAFPRLVVCSSCVQSCVALGSHLWSWKIMWLFGDFPGCWWRKTRSDQAGIASKLFSTAFNF